MIKHRKYKIKINIDTINFNNFKYLRENKCVTAQ